jgi:formylmethanofuran dehydrogenase subunit C
VLKIQSNKSKKLHHVLVQTKLKVSKLGDIYEQEADRVADQIMQMPSDTVRRKCSRYQMEDGELKINRKTDSSGDFQVSDSIIQQINDMKGGGLHLMIQLEIL